MIEDKHTYIVIEPIELMYLRKETNYPEQQT